MHEGLPAILPKSSTNTCHQFSENTHSAHRLIYTRNYPLIVSEVIGAFSLALWAKDCIPLQIYGGGKFFLSMYQLFEGTINKVIDEQVMVGDHMSFHSEYYQAITARELSDGVKIYPGDKLGELEFLMDINTLQPEENLFQHIRELYTSAQVSLQKLAQLCQQNDPLVKNIVAFHGFSHLAGPAAVKLGFDTAKISDPILRFAVSMDAMDSAKGTASENHMWREFKKNFKTPREAFISRQTLVSRYGQPT